MKIALIITLIIVVIAVITAVIAYALQRWKNEILIGMMVKNVINENEHKVKQPEQQDPARSTIELDAEELTNAILRGVNAAIDSSKDDRASIDDTHQA